MRQRLVERLKSPWNEKFDHLLRCASHSLIMCSPFVGKQPCARVIEVLSETSRSNVSILIVTNLRTDNILSGATDVSALVELCKAFPATEVRFLPNLHAKVYVADEKRAVVTSANLTDGGLTTNVEYGLWLCQAGLVSRVRADIMEYGTLGSLIPFAELRAFETTALELRDMRVRLERSMRGTLRREFAKRLRAADEQILTARAEGMSAHAAFADTILFVLRNRPLDTKSIYSEVQKIHPDLCDDTVKLKIRGEIWNQAEWHHRVRHAQLYLRRQGRIARSGARWHLAM